MQDLPSQRQKGFFTKRRIFQLRQDVEIYLEHGNTADVRRLLADVQKFESDLQRRRKIIMNANDISSLFEESTAPVTGALVELGRALTGEALFQRLADAATPLKREQQEKISEAQALRKSHSNLKARVAAQIRILRGEIDVDIAAGRDSEVQEKQRQAQDLTANLDNILRQADDADQRARDLSAQQRELARAIFAATWPELRRSLVAVEAGLTDLLDKTWADLLRYAEENGLQGDGSPGQRLLVTPMTKSDLTARENGPEKPVFQKLLQWFGPAR